VWIGIPAELQIPIALLEFIGGICLIVGIFTRVTGVLFSTILLGAIFHVGWEKGFFISQGGWNRIL
jgi:putative oxidoreductase